MRTLVRDSELLNVCAPPQKKQPNSCDCGIDHQTQLFVHRRIYISHYRLGFLLIQQRRFLCIMRDKVKGQIFKPFRESVTAVAKHRT